MATIVKAPFKGQGKVSGSMWYARREMFTRLREHVMALPVDSVSVYLQFKLGNGAITPWYMRVSIHEMYSDRMCMALAMGSWESVRIVAFTRAKGKRELETSQARELPKGGVLRDMCLRQWWEAFPEHMRLAFVELGAAELDMYFGEGTK